jgi:hypothetical protein
MITYEEPVITLIGNSTDVVLTKRVVIFDNVLPPSYYDSSAFVEAEW